LANRILWINPLGTNAFDEGIHEMLIKSKEPETEITVVSLKRGPQHVEYHFYDTLVVMDLLDRIREAEEQGFSAAIIGCFYDPGVREAREISTRMVVTGLCEPCVHVASSLGHKFSVIVGRKKWIPKMEENVLKYGFENRLAGFKAVELGVYDFQKDPGETYRRIKEAASFTIEENLAEVVILACTAEARFTQKLQDELQVPVLDSIRAPLKYAEMLVSCAERFNWHHSKKYDYESPPSSEISEWALRKQYGLSDAWERFS